MFSCTYGKLANIFERIFNRCVKNPDTLVAHSKYSYSELFHLFRGSTLTKITLIFHPQPASIFWLIGVVTGFLYWFSAMGRSGVAFEQLAELPSTTVIIWKIVCELMLVCAVCFSVKNHIHKVLAVSISTIFIADIILALGYVTYAGYVFIVAHLLAAFCYYKSPEKTRINNWRNVMGFSILGSVVILAAFLYIISDSLSILMLFPIFSAAVAVSALRSSFPLLLSSLGAIIFWLSDMLFVSASILQENIIMISWLVWPSFFGGLSLMVLGIMINASSRETDIE